ncbi:MAG: NAD(P)H-dependent oxidoreductase subunit E [Chloroflexota bacterium]
MTPRGTTVTEATASETALNDILGRHRPEPGQLVPVLLEVQDSFGYLPADIISNVASFLGTAVGQIYSVASFYSHFRLKPVGRHRLTVCLGTSCYIHGAPKIMTELEKETGIKDGETSEDMAYTLESVACVGCCALAPVVKVNGAVHAEMTPQRVKAVVPSREEGKRAA